MNSGTQPEDPFATGSARADERVEPLDERAALASLVPAGLLPLAGLAVVDVRGDEALAFLQGQFSNDLVALVGGRAQLTGYCSPKGRLLASVIAWRLSGGARLVVPADIVEAFVKRLRMFVMRAKVEVMVRRDLACVGLLHRADAPAPNGAGAALEALFGGAVASLPGPLDVVAVPGESFEAVPGESSGAASDEPPGASVTGWYPLRCADTTSLARTLLILPRPDGDDGWLGRAASSAGVGTLDAAHADALWRLGDLRAGIASVRAATQDAFVPQTVNFAETDGLNFRKGCYPGQEIVARMQYLGKLKRHMRRYVASGGSGDVPAPGAALGPGDVGRTVDAIATRDGLELLAVVPIGRDDPLEWGGMALTEASLPYAPPGPGEGRGRPNAETAPTNDAPMDGAATSDATTSGSSA